MDPSLVLEQLDLHCGRDYTWKNQNGKTQNPNVVAIGFSVGGVDHSELLKEDEKIDETAAFVLHTSSSSLKNQDYGKIGADGKTQNSNA